LLVVSNFKSLVKTTALYLEGRRLNVEIAVAFEILANSYQTTMLYMLQRQQYSNTNVSSSNFVEESKSALLCSDITQCCGLLSIFQPLKPHDFKRQRLHTKKSQP